jgi:hypothetical protein
MAATKNRPVAHVDGGVRWLDGDAEGPRHGQGDLDAGAAGAIVGDAHVLARVLRLHVQQRQTLAVGHDFDALVGQNGPQLGLHVAWTV